ALERTRFGGLLGGLRQSIAGSERMCYTASNVGLRAAPFRLRATHLNNRTWCRLPCSTPARRQTLRVFLELVQHVPSGTRLGRSHEA
ncbi:MAG: hypothetical protein MI924_34050, partial [Chloroflexales bacterium]|nr:hypothetical protein [Chloroflexales bacterium]